VSEAGGCTVGPTLHLSSPRRADRLGEIDIFIEHHPAFQLEDELLVKGEGMSCGATSTLVGAAPGTRDSAQRVTCAGSAVGAW